MPNPKPDTKGLRPNPHTLGVEPLEEDELSKPVRVRAKKSVHEQLKDYSAKEIGDMLENALEPKEKRP